MRNFGSHIGQALFADEVVGVDFGENWVSVEPEADYDQTLATIQEIVDGYPGLFRDVQTYLKERVREVLTGTSEAVVVRISGDDLDGLREKADEVRGALRCRRPRRPAHASSRRTCRTSRWRRTSTPPSATASSPATSAGRRRPGCRAKR